MKCEICGFEAKNESGLRLHSKKHKNGVVSEKKTIADVVVPITGEVMLSYSLEVHGEDFGILATDMAKRKNLEVRFR